MRFQWWPTVLLEWDSNLANISSVIEKSKFFENFHFFPVTFCRWLGKNYIDTSNNCPQLVQYIVNKNDKFWFSFKINVLYKVLLIASFHLRTKSLSKLSTWFFGDLLVYFGAIWIWQFPALSRGFPVTSPESAPFPRKKMVGTGLPCSWYTGAVLYPSNLGGSWYPGERYVKGHALTPEEPHEKKLAQLVHI